MLSVRRFLGRECLTWFRVTDRQRYPNFLLAEFGLSPPLLTLAGPDMYNTNDSVRFRCSRKNVLHTHHQARTLSNKRSRRLGFEEEEEEEEEGEEEQEDDEEEDEDEDEDEEEEGEEEEGEVEAGEPDEASK